VSLPTTTTARQGQRVPEASGSCGAHPIENTAQHTAQHTTRHSTQHVPAPPADAWQPQPGPGAPGGKMRRQSWRPGAGWQPVCVCVCVCVLGGGVGVLEGEGERVHTAVRETAPDRRRGSTTAATMPPHHATRHTRPASDHHHPQTHTPRPHHPRAQSSAGPMAETMEHPKTHWLQGAPLAEP